MSNTAGAATPPGPGQAGAPGHELGHALASLRHQLGHLERLVEGGGGGERGPATAPAWMRPATGEERWPVALALAAAILLQLVLPDQLAVGPRWLLPSLEAAIAIGLVAANPRHIDRRSAALRAASVTLIAIASVANGYSSFALISHILEGTAGKSAGPLLATGASIYVTNILVFALWYWEWDRGGPVARAMGERPYPDLLYPQMTQEHLAPADWRPTFVDYLYVSYTNATAFSPTDTMPLARWAKLMFLAQSAIALATVALVVARAVNILS